MNAYELADDEKNISNAIEALEWVQKATPLLRQQEDRILLLEKRFGEILDSHHSLLRKNIKLRRERDAYEEVISKLREA